MNLDSHSSGDGYTIRSLYFDSLEDVDWQEKEDGVELRRKIRLRNYGSHSSFAKLEMKQKQGANQKKRSLRLTKADAQELIRGNNSVLLAYPDDFAAECYARMSMHLYQPKTVIEYQRKAFVAKENNIRITFDHHIIGTESCYDIFSENLNQYYLLNPCLVVLEVKYNGFLLSYIKELLTSVNGNNVALSLGMVGALSVVRFRTAIKDSRDTAYIFWTIVVGICCDVGDYVVASLGSGVIFILLWIMGRVRNEHRLLLIVRCDRSLEVAVEGVFFQYFAGRAIQRVKNATADSIEMIFEISKKDYDKQYQEDNQLMAKVDQLGNVDYFNIISQSDEING